MTKHLPGLAFALLALVALGPEADAAQASRCTAAQLKAAGKKASSRAKCYAKGVKKGEQVQMACLDKASTKFSAAYAKATQKPPCLSMVSENTIEIKVDGFVDQVRTTVNSSAQGPSACDAQKIQAAGKKAAGKAGCYSKQVAKGDAQVDSTCLGKAESKFGAAIDKAENPGTGCTHTGQKMAIEQDVDTFIADLVNELDPPPTTTSTTSTSSTTTTTPPPSEGQLSFTTAVGTTSCGGPGLNPGPTTPFSGELDSDTTCMTKIADLGLSCLYIGGGNGKAIPPGSVPENVALVFEVNGSNLFASSGTGSKDCTHGAGPGKQCINNDVEPACTADLNCNGYTGACALDANCFFGPPLQFPNPVLSSLSTCVVNVIQTDGSGTFAANTGDASVNLLLASRVYVTGNLASPCPHCMGGTCTAGPNATAACTTDNSQLTSLDCTPEEGGGAFQAALAINLGPLVTTTSKATSSTGLFCPNQKTAGAFGLPAALCIVQDGMPAGDLTDGLPHPAVLGYSFCIPTTTNSTVDGVADLPGPGSVGLNVNAQLTETTTTTSTTTSSSVVAITTTSTTTPVTLPPCGSATFPACLGDCASGTCMPDLMNMICTCL